MAQLKKLTLNLDENERNALEGYAAVRDDSMSKVVRSVMRHFFYERGLLDKDSHPPAGDEW